MSERSVTHATFVIERTYDASPARVFAAFATRDAKWRWFGGPDEWETETYELDFRVDGRESYRGRPPGGPATAFDGRYQDIVPDRRVVYTYDMHLDGTRISVSLATIELEPVAAGTRLRFTEQGAFLDGKDRPADREQGTGDLLDSLGAVLRRETANA